MDALRHNLRLFYVASIDWLKSLEQNDKVYALKNVLISKSQDILDALRSHEVYAKILDRVDNLKYFMYKEGTLVTRLHLEFVENCILLMVSNLFIFCLVSKQAIYFGCGGLLTGVIVGVAVGYGYRTSPAGSNSFHNGSANNYLMRGIVASNCKRGIDVSCRNLLKII